MKTLFQCKGDDCYEKAIVDVSCIPTGWIVIGIAQNMLDEDEGHPNACEFQIEFCSPEHASAKLGDINKFRAVIAEESEENV